MSSQASDARYPCYDLVEGAEILQGDLFEHCPVIIPTANTVDEIEAREDLLDGYLDNYDVAVMSQSCDLKYEKIDLILVCPVWTYESMAQKYNHFRKSENKIALQRGNLPGYHLLRECEVPGHERPVSVVDFRSVYSVPFDFLKRFAGEQSPRLRLMPPYREHLAQAFARFFMRVGLPVDVTIP